MKIFEVENRDYQQLVALSELLIGRAKDTGAEKKISIESFIQMARSIGLNISEEQLRDLTSQLPLSNIIANVTDTEVVFKGANEYSSDQMSVDQARDTVDKMAHRAAN